MDPQELIYTSKIHLPGIYHLSAFMQPKAVEDSVTDTSTVFSNFRLVMRRHTIYLSVISIIFSLSLYAQDVVTLSVYDTQGNSLPYPEIVIGNIVHRVGTEKGTLEIPRQYFNVGDTVKVKYLGFKTSELLIDDISKTRNDIKVSMEAEAFLLDPVIVTATNFSGDNYFEQRIKNSPAPHSRKYFYDIEYVFKDQSQIEKTYVGKAEGYCRNSTTKIVRCKLAAPDNVAETSHIATLLKRASEISILMANAFLSNKERDYFNCSYKGEANNLELWEFYIKKQDIMPWNLEKDDQYKCLVSLSHNGLIKNIKTQRLTSSDHSFSYLLDTEYDLYEDKLVPKTVTLELVPSASNKVCQPLSISAIYSNFRKRK